MWVFVARPARGQASAGVCFVGGGQYRDFFKPPPSHPFEKETWGKTSRERILIDAINFSALIDAFAFGRLIEIAQGDRIRAAAPRCTWPWVGEGQTLKRCSRWAHRPTCMKGHAAHVFSGNSKQLRLNYADIRIICLHVCRSFRRSASGGFLKPLGRNIRIISFFSFSPPDFEN